MKFKIGDIVKVVCADKKSSTYSTREKIGQVGKIVKSSGVKHIPWSIYFETNNEILNFMEKEIELNTKINEQLLFNFMN